VKVYPLSKVGYRANAGNLHNLHKGDKQHAFFLFQLKCILMTITDWIYSEEFTELEKGFLQWLETLNYSPATIASRKRNIREFLLYLERCGIKSIAEASQYKTGRFVRYLKRRENRLYGSGLMNASVNVGISTVNKFFEYLTQTGIHRVPDKLTYLNGNYKPRQVLTVKEIDQLYALSYIKNPNVKPKNREMEEAVQMRDRAMLAVYYGCGLRKSEGTGLMATDIQVERKIVFVRSGKGSKQRNVPVIGNTLTYLKEYLQIGRKILLERTPEPTYPESFFINQYGEACSDQALSLRLDLVVKNSGSSSLQKKRPTLHTLRHSIATHLLQQGMQIELIQQFLGHASLESTQLYTHIVNEL
jgi:site-specific recombinase XerD